MELVERIDKFRHTDKVFGYKKLLGPYILIDYGFKKDVKLFEESIALQNMLEVASSAGDEFYLPSEVLSRVEADYKFIECALYFNDFGSLFYIKPEVSFWYSEDPVEVRTEVEELVRDNRLVWQGAILYTKKRAGFYIKLFGNYYFLPRGESFNSFRAGMWDDYYLILFKNSGLYFSSIMRFLSQDSTYWNESRSLVGGVGKVNSLSCLLEYSLLEQLLLFLQNQSSYKGKVRTGDPLRGELVEALALYYEGLKPVLDSLAELQRVGLELGLTNEDIQRFLLEGFERDGIHLEGVLDKLGAYSLISQNVYGSVLGSQSLVGYCYLLEVYSILLEHNLAEVMPDTIRIDVDASIDVLFSQIVDGGEGKLTSVSRKGIAGGL